MNIEESLMQMNREDATRIIVNVLEYFNDDDYRCGVVFCYTSLLKEKEYDIILMAPPRRNDCDIDFAVEKNLVSYPGNNEGYCKKCSFIVSSDCKYAMCPLCGSPVYLT